mmetsp:Transcript_57356/g.167912  ORF Transcript_57356/g.167912 Transcript_57356/m.167912 type:complete len:94 (+) Transcript_57356:745-1026(+)
MFGRMEADCAAQNDPSAHSQAPPLSQALIAALQDTTSASSRTRFILCSTSIASRQQDLRRSAVIACVHARTSSEGPMYMMVAWWRLRYHAHAF